MKRQNVIALIVGFICCTGLYQTYSHQKESVKQISRMRLEGATTPQSGNVTVNYQQGNMPLVHVAPKLVTTVSDNLISDDAFSVPVAQTTTLEEETEDTITIEQQPASPWDALTRGDVNLQMISLIQGRRYAVINGHSVKRGDVLTVRVANNKNISLIVTDVKPDRVMLTLEDITRSITLT